MKAVRSLVKPCLRRLRGFRGCARGASAVEYGLILALIVLTLMAALSQVADVTVGMWGNVSTKVAAAR